ncbi:serine/threonine protein kinase [Dictyobacter aurantiacus]|uniref:non-specific serine/threonine protein kinase n=1 Tax=Dictyobacter aurantiacus TaxID=1936993 RepID=A0A401ZFN2_9CHLR|nr:serine/threonine-protein kinase [Dictyobacter aurantiacus]GCE05677.1 hypothetical protein KDAU_30060 [Dictyobacter aurantiacus]
MMASSRPLVAGTVLRERYKIERVLGNGGSSIVYLARDLAKETHDEEENNYVALKELHTDNRKEQVHFAFEGRVLKKLKHPSLPRIYDVYEDTEQQSSFLVMEYIEGPNLETLRRQQPGQRFTLDEVLRFIQPIIEAVIYLHHQQPAIIHRDIKPSNIIITAHQQRAVLIDFGIAKEFEVDATTSALRHCTPGYGAPEQYGNLSTDVHTDIYALAATCYCLLTGSVPVDAFERAATIVSKRVDPLKPVHILAPAIPPHVSQALERAMEISMEQRYDRVEDFWSAMKQSASAPGQPDTGRKKRTGTIQATSKGAQKQRHRRIIQLTTISGIILLLGIILAIGSIANAFQSPQSVHPTATMQSTHAAVKPHPTATASATGPYPRLTTAYRGTLSNLSKQATGTMTLTNIQQQQQQISGHFTGMNRAGNFTGVVDASNHILITISASAQQPPLFFEGVVRPDGNLVGDYCNQDGAGQCVGNYGLWSLSPTP